MTFDFSTLYPTIPHAQLQGSYVTKSAEVDMKKTCVLLRLASKGHIT